MCPNPSYPIHAFGFLMAGGTIRSVPAEPGPEFFDALQRAVNHSIPKPIAVILCYPANPTAAVADLEFYRDAVAFAKKHDIILLSDLAYSEIYFDDNPPPSVLQVPGAMDVTVEFTSLSKTYSMPGYRMGFAVAGTPNLLEYDQGFFVKGGDGLADVKPICKLYKTQVYRLAAHLGVPQSILSRPPTTDTFSMPQSQEEFYFTLPYPQMDLCLYALDHGYTWFDTAPVYGWGRSEAVLRKALGPRLRDVIVATKVGVREIDGHAQSTLTADWTAAQDLWRERAPMRRAARPEDIAQAVAMLVAALLMM